MSSATQGLRGRGASLPPSATCSKSSIRCFLTRGGMSMSSPTACPAPAGPAAQRAARSAFLALCVVAQRRHAPQTRHTRRYVAQSGSAHHMPELRLYLSVHPCVVYTLVMCNLVVYTLVATVLELNHHPLQLPPSSSCHSLLLPIT